MKRWLMGALAGAVMGYLIPMLAVTVKTLDEGKPLFDSIAAAGLADIRVAAPICLGAALGCFYVIVLR